MSLSTRTKVKPPRSISATVDLVTGLAVIVRGRPIEGGQPTSYYVLYRDEIEIATGLDSVSYRDTDVLAGESHSYYFSTVNVYETESSGGDPATAQLPRYPVWESGWSVTLNQSSSVNISARCIDPDGGSLTHSRVGGTAPAAVTISTVGVLSSGLSAAGTYTLVLRANNGSLYSDTTVNITVNVVSVSPEPPVNFSAVPSSSTAVALSWQKPATGPDPDDYDVEYSSTNTWPGTSLPVIGAGLSYSHTGRTTGTHYYRIKSKFGGLSSAWVYAQAIIETRSGTTTGTGTNAIFNGGWGSGEDVVNGWDWSLPSSAEPAEKSGVFTWENDPHPSYWQARKILIVNAAWGGTGSTPAARAANALEPSSGTYNFDVITDAIANGSWDGIFLNVRGFVTIPASGYAVEKTAPEWMINNPVTYPVYTLNGTTSLLMRNANVMAKHKALIAEIGASGILSNAKIFQQIIHLPGSSSGEEFNSNQGSPTEDYAAAEEYITAWGNAAGSNKTKLMWTDDYGQVEDVLDHAMNTVGVGTRGGAIEYWLWNQYSPGLKRYTGQTYTGGTLNGSGVYVGGYLGVDETHPCIDSRGWHDQNESRNSYSDPTNGLQQQNYRMAHLRAMQMRRKILWVRDAYLFNPRMDHWAAMNAGHKVDTAHEAWCCLMRTWTRSNNNGAGTDTREINNFEKWLYQRDTAGAVTTPDPNLKVFHGTNKTQSTGLPSTEWYINLARKGTNIELSLDTRFLNAAANVAVKVIWYDSSSEAWSLVYTKASGGTGTKTFPAHTATNVVRTQTFSLTDFTAAPTIDLRLTSGGNTPFMFVRVIKL